MNLEIFWQSTIFAMARNWRQQAEAFCGLTFFVTNLVHNAYDIMSGFTSENIDIYIIQMHAVGVLPIRIVNCLTFRA